MRTDHRHVLQQAFTRLELLACLASGGLLVALALPALATDRSRSQTAQCLNNLRLVGRAVQMWGMEHREMVPWRLTVSDGGASGSPFGGNAWIQFQLMSNELATPRILACPAENQVKVASEFSVDFTRGGYLATGFRGAATSYFINLHTLAENPLSPISGDTNIRVSYPAACGFTGIVNASAIDPFDHLAGWTNATHGTIGNVVLMDGSVVTTTTGQLRAALDVADGNAAHLLRAR